MERELKKILKGNLEHYREMDIGTARHILIEIVDQYISQMGKGEKYLDKIAEETERVKEKLKENGEQSLEEGIRECLKGFVSRNIERFSGTTLGKLYEAINTTEIKKRFGQVYTPEDLVDYMLEDAEIGGMAEASAKIKILDPSCGAGIFLVKLYRKLRQISEKNRCLSEEHILRSVIYGVDIDFFSVYISKVSLLMESKLPVEMNIELRDILTQECQERFDLILGNPPYIGAKKLDRSYKDKLRKLYPEVYEDKSDISYCFFKRGYDLLSDGGKMEIVTSRYFIEALYADKLRAYIGRVYGIEKIVDFYGENIFKGISISPAVVKLVKDAQQSSLSYSRPNGKWKKRDMLNAASFESIEVKPGNLFEGRWLMRSKEETDLFRKIDRAGELVLKDISSSSQGIITGFDRAFVLEGIQNVPENEMYALKPWVKNSDVKRYGAINPNKYLIYTDCIDDIDKTPYLKSLIEEHREVLESRRECKLGIRAWHDIQWGRDSSNFKGERIIFPYKAHRGSYTMVSEELYHSADVYSIKLKKEFESLISTEYLLGFLNSKLFEYYFRSVGKKLNRDIYEYYPNKIMGLRIKIPDSKTKKAVVDLVREIMNGPPDEKPNMERELDSIFAEIYKLELDERNLVHAKFV